VAGKGFTSLIGRITDTVRGNPYARGMRAAQKGKHADAAAAWQEGAKAGDPECQMALAEALDEGRGVLRNPRNAVRWYRTAAENGVARAQARLAGFYSIGIGDPSDRDGGDPRRESFSLPQDDVQARHWAEKAASQGLPEAQVLLAWLYCRDGGENAARDPVRAEHWYRAAMAQGSVKAIVGLANMITAGDVEGNGPEQAFALYSQAAAQGDHTAEYYTGLYLLEGIGTAPDHETARQWLFKAGEGGIVAACRTLGIIHRRGRGAPRNNGIAETWLRRAAARGDAESMAMLADMHMGGEAAIPNPSEAIVLYTAAAELGHAGAQAALGLAHLHGQNVPKDPLRAVDYLEKASATGYPEAAFQLGLCYLEGRGIPVDYARAAQYLLKAAEGGHANATYNMGVLFYHGHGVAQDRDKAMHLYAKAADMGSASGQFRLGHAYATGQEQLPADPEKALHWFTAAAAQGHVPAQVNLVRLLTSRSAPREELERWRDPLHKAASHGIGIAMTALAEMKWNIDRDADAAIAMARSAVELGDPLAENVVQYLEARNFNGVVR
jgi:TPR repeat protein